MRNRGTGCKYAKHGVWWVKVSDHGKIHCESTGLKGSAGETKADRLLAKYGEQIEAGTFQRPTKPITFEEMAAMLEADYVANGRKSLDRALRSTAHLKPHFKGMRAMDIPAKVSEYIVERFKVAKPGTVRLELAALKRMFSLAFKVGRISQRPYIPSVEVRNTRQGFFEDEQFRAVLSKLDAAIQPLAEFAYLTGWRKTEMLTLQWRQIDLKAQVIRLEPDSTKNDEGRTFPFGTYPQLKALILLQREHTKALERALGRIIPNVFHRDGWPIRNYYDAWRDACEAAGCPDRLMHDFRRTAVRNLERASVARSVAMKLTGHLTESVYRRYAIVNEADLAEGVAKLSQSVASRAASAEKREA